MTSVDEDLTIVKVWDSKPGNEDQFEDVWLDLYVVTHSWGFFGVLWTAKDCGGVVACAHVCTCLSK